MPLLPEDAEYLADAPVAYEVRDDGGMTCIVLLSWRLPPGMDQAQADLLIRLAPGYPDIAPDMWWVDPPLRLASGVEIPATQSIETFLDRQWQRWSRHFNTGQWQPGTDRLRSYLALVEQEFQRTVLGSAA
jgi:hypothetical protein